MFSRYLDFSEITAHALTLILSRSHTHSQAQQLILEKSLNVKSALKHAFIFAVKHFTSQQIKQFIFS